MDHLDSLGAGQDVKGRVELLNEVMHMILQNDGIPAVATRRTVDAGRYKNAFCFFSLSGSRRRAGKWYTRSQGTAEVQATVAYLIRSYKGVIRR